MKKRWRERIPQVTRTRAESAGAPGRTWLAQLDDLVEHLEARWNVRMDRALPGGSESLVADVEMADGGRAIAKIGLPTSANLATEAAVLRLADGRGYARLLAEAADCNAVLLERLGERLSAVATKTDASVEAQIRTLCATLRAAWIPLDESRGFMTGADKARWLADFIDRNWSKFGRPCPRETVHTALDFIAERAAAYDPATSVLVHGDAHADNTLQDPEAAGGYRFVDPDGLCAEPACDLAVPMREWSRELLHGDTARLGRQRCALLALLTGADERAIWQWGFIERVSTGLALLELGLREEAADSLAVATAFTSAF